MPALLLPGDVCDIVGLYVRRYDYSVVMLIACHVASIGRDALLNRIDEYPRIGQALTWLAFVENAVLSEWIACLGRRSAREHLAHLLCELHARLDAVAASTGAATCCR
ncbi:Crp/Fnr family transcriptional regulator [Sphingomonas sp.]|uniref:Crp/Fnr family transcriptional regulator n=1 Tax=Sphingomonas sp. TaxID=28214 RepID=UPI003B00B5CC